MASITPDSSTAPCAHCGKDVPSSNIDLHFAFCSRNLEKCKICDDMIPKKNMDEHYHNSHAPVDCSLCSQTIERELLDIHKGEKCPQRIVTCEYCEFPLPAVDLSKHQEVCGNRTEYCNMCNQYVRLREWDEHEIRLHYNLDGNAQSSSYWKKLVIDNWFELKVLPNRRYPDTLWGSKGRIPISLLRMNTGIDCFLNFGEELMRFVLGYEGICYDTMLRKSTAYHSCIDNLI